MCPEVEWASKNEYQVNPGGKDGRCIRLTTYQLHVPISRNLGALPSWNPVGLFRPVMGLLYLFTFTRTQHGQKNKPNHHATVTNNNLLKPSFHIYLLIHK
jgi:hypothetical protein